MYSVMMMTMTMTQIQRKNLDYTSQVQHDHVLTNDFHSSAIPYSAKFSWNLIFAFFVELLTSTIQRKLFDQLASLVRVITRKSQPRNLFLSKQIL